MAPHGRTRYAIAMTYTLIIGDRSYSSWSLRGWLLFEKFAIPHTLKHVSFSDSRSGWDLLDDYRPAKTVPVMATDDGAIIDDSLAIAEELATRHADAGIWPSDPLARATARTLACEMHSSFGALRNDCPMNLRATYRDFPASDDVLADIDRIKKIWSNAFDTFKGPWLCGEYSAADVFYAPVVARIITYGLPVSKRAQAYIDLHLNDLAFRRWRAMGLVKGDDLPWYAMDHAQTDWPGPATLPAKPVASGPSENETCPYSGLPVTDFMELNGRVFGFCNPFCRDKTVPDPEAWPAFMEIYHS